MSKNRHRGGHQAPTQRPAPANPPSGGSAGKPADTVSAEPARAPVSIFLRLAPGIHAARGAEVEIYDNGARMAGGNQLVEFNLWTETWVEIRVLRA